MATLANSYDFLNKHMDIGVKDFRNLVKNKVLTSLEDVDLSFMGFNFGSLSNIGSVIGQVKSMIDMVKNLPAKILTDLKNSIDRVLGDLLKTPLSIYGSGIMKDLINMSEDGVKDFLVENLEIGSMRLCANLNIFQGILDGFDIPQNILDGLMLGLSIDWMERLCKPVTAEEESRMTPKQRLEVSHPYAGTPYTPESTLFDFSSLMSGMYNNSPIDKVEYDEKVYFKHLKEGTVDDFFKEVAPVMTPTLHKDLETGLEKFYNKVTDPKKNFVRGKLRLIPKYGEEHVGRAFRLPRSKDALGSYIKNLQTKDIVLHNSYSYIDVENSIVKKIKEIKAETRDDLQFKSRTNGEGQFQDFDFDKILGKFTEEEAEYMVKHEPSKYSSLYNGLHPTTEVFVRPNIPFIKKRLPINP